jgi:hypothetical protein
MHFAPRGGGSNWSAWARLIACTGPAVLHVLETTTPEQDEAIALAIARWRSNQLSTEPIDRDGAQRAIVDLYRYVQSDPPVEFAFYESPHAALSDFERWRGGTGRHTQMYWSYQLPMCDPSSYFRVCQKLPGMPAGAVDLAVRRSPNVHRCFSYAESIAADERPYIAGALLDDVWSRFAGAIGLDWFDAADTEAHESFDKVEDGLYEVIDREEPSSPIGALDWVRLGPISWLVAEAACAEACRDVLGVRINPEYVDAVTGVASKCGGVYAFERLVVLCDRASKIELAGDQLQLTFRDGAQAAGPAGVMGELEDLVRRSQRDRA